MTILDRTDTGAIAHLHMTAPERLNALSDAMLAALQAAFDQIGSDPAIRVVILSGAGKAFCAGHDLKEMQAGRQAEDGGAARLTDLVAVALTGRRYPGATAVVRGGSPVAAPPPRKQSPTWRGDSVVVVAVGACFTHRSATPYRRSGLWKCIFAWCRLEGLAHTTA